MTSGSPSRKRALSYLAPLDRDEIVRLAIAFKTGGNSIDSPIRDFGLRQEVSFLSLVLAACQWTEGCPAELLEAIPGAQD